MKLTQLLTLSGLMAVFGFVGTLRSEPTLWFGEEGVNQWISTYNSTPNIHPLDGGQRALVVWNEVNGPVGTRLICAQIITSDGEFEIEEPLILSDPEQDAHYFYPYQIDVFDDTEGNLFIFWYYYFEDQRILTIQKIDRAGNLLWGDRGREYDDFCERYSDNRVYHAFSDQAGGCYIKTSVGILAFGDDGQLREEWPWHTEFPDGLNVTDMYPDAAGGVWYMNSQDVWNKLDNAGEKLYQEAQEILWSDPPIQGWNFVFGLGGPMLCQYHAYADRYNNTLGFFLTDSLNHYRGDEFLHCFQFDRNNIWNLTTNLGEGRIILSYGDGNVTLFDASQDSTPWGVSGIQFEFPVETESFKALNAPDGDIISLAYSNCYRVDPNHILFFRRIRPDGSIAIERDLGGIAPVAAVSDADGGFWLAAQPPHGSFTKPEYYMNRITSQGIKVWEEDLHLPIHKNRSMEDTHVWIDNDSEIHTIFTQSKVGLTINTVSPEGQVGGEPNGTVIFSADSLNSASELGQGMTLDERVLYACSPWYCDSLQKPHLFSFSYSGRLQWYISLTESIPNVWGKPHIITSPDQRRAVVMLRQGSVVDRDYQHVLLVYVNLEDGEIIGRQDAPGMRGMGDNRLCTIIGLDGGFYTVNWQAGDSLRVQSYDYDGNQHWQSPFTEHQGHNIQIFGAVESDEGGLWIGKYRQDLQNGLVEVWLSQLSEDGLWTDDSIPVYAQECRYDAMRSIQVNFFMIKSGANIWVVSDMPGYAYPNYGIQCISPEGELLLGDLGWLQENNSYDRYYSAVRDNEGGVWYVWTRSLNGKATLRAVHFDEDAHLYPGYEAEGFTTLTFSNFEIGYPTLLNDRSIALTLGGRLQCLGEHAQDVDIPVNDRIPTSLEIQSMFPQPFNDRLTIKYHQGTGSEADISVFDLAGREVKSIQMQNNKSVDATISVNFAQQPAGIYFIRLSDGRDSVYRKIILMR